MAMHLGGHMGGMPVRAPSHQALLDSFNEQFRSPMSDDWAGTQPRKARWNRKVSTREGVGVCARPYGRAWLAGSVWPTHSYPSPPKTTLPQVTRKRAKRPSTAVRKGRLAVYCIASELQV